MTGTEMINQPSNGTEASPGPSSRGAARQQGWRTALTSPPISSRIAVGFAALCVIKLIMLVSLRKHLYEIHWRVGEEEVNWINSVAFYLFAVLAGLNLWKLGTHCMPAGVRLVRVANAVVLFLSIFFILITFHAGDRNYINGIMIGKLDAKGLGWYLINSSFFEIPFLSVWILAYAFIYYGLWRKGREQFMLRVTAVFATAYILICLRDFQEYRTALIIVDCLGLACLVLNGGSLNPFWIALPLLGAGSFMILFHPLERGLQLSKMNPEFIVLLLGYLIVLAGATVVAWKRKFISGWWRILPFLLAAFLLIDVNYPASPNYQNVLFVGLTLPRYFLGELGLMLGVWLVAGGYRKIFPTGSLLWLDILNLLLVTLALADLRLTQIMQVRLDWDVMSLAAGETTKMMWRMARPYLPSVGLALLAVAIVYAVALWAIQRRAMNPPQESGENPRPRGRSFAFALVACVLLGIVGIAVAPPDKAEGQVLLRFAASSPLLKRTSTPIMERAAFLKTATELGLADAVAATPAAAQHAPRDLNVVLVFQESTYNKHLSLFGGTEGSEPLLSQYKDRMELFPNFFSVFAGSINARFATFTGLYPVEDYHIFTTERVPVKSIFETLRDHGYDCSMFYSSYFDYTDFRGLLRNRGIDGMYDADTMPGADKSKSVSWGLPEEETLGAMRRQIKAYAADNKKFFMTYVPAAPHNPFDGTPRQFQKKQIEKIGDLSPLYFNELLYMDWTIASLVDELKQSGLLDKTLVIITADHGEMLGENNGPVGHGWFITPELANVPLIILDPGHPGYHVNDTVGSQVDLLPTILDKLGIPLPQGQLYQGASLYSSNLDTNRTIYLNSFREYGELRGARIVTGDRDTEKQGGTASRQAFDIANEGSHTTFAPQPTAAVDAPSISTFDAFQKNLLRNYSAYCRMFHPDEPAQVAGGAH